MREWRNRGQTESGFFIVYVYCYSIVQLLLYEWRSLIPIPIRDDDDDDKISLVTSGWMGIGSRQKNTAAAATIYVCMEQTNNIATYSS